MLINFARTIFIVTLLMITAKVNATTDCTSGVCLDYQDSFGAVLIGAVKVQQNAIWSSRDANVYTTKEQFSFLGVEAYVDQVTFKPSNKWVVEGINYIHL